MVVLAEEDPNSLRPVPQRASKIDENLKNH